MNEKIEYITFHEKDHAVSHIPAAYNIKPSSLAEFR
jgi:hypothetical protein